MTRSPAELAALMATSGPAQLVHTAFRCSLVDGWPVTAGSSVVEIACGQGDTTAVLADRVGSTGRVVAVDPAPAGYGAPVTVGESLAHLQRGPLGDRLEVRLGSTSLAGRYDLAVLALGSWYFPTRESLVTTLRAARDVADRLCFAEWDLAPAAFDQVAHLLAVLLQGQDVDPSANVRLPLARAELLAVIAEAGWTVATVTDVDTAGMPDAGWEIDMALARTPASGFLGSQAEVLRTLAAAPVRPLGVFSLVAS